jgi:hypothetical protein
LKPKPNITGEDMTTLIQLPSKTPPANHPEIELLLCCARTHIDSETEKRILTLLEQDINWLYLIQTASRHGVVPLVYQSLKNTCCDAVPQNILKQLQDYFHTNALNNLYRTKELLKLLDLFKENGMSAVPFKGPVLAASAYGNLSLRQFCDLDILIHKPDALKIRELLVNNGYRLLIEELNNATPAQEAMYLQADCEYNFLRNDSRVAVEPHWGFTHRKFCISLNPEHLWRRLGNISLAGVTVPTFSPEDSLLIVCINGTKDHWRSLKLICDVAEIIRSHQDLDWDAVMEQARIIGCYRILLLGLFLASDLLGAVLTEKVWHIVNTDVAVKSLAHQVREQLFANVAQPAKQFGSNFSVWDIQVRERKRDRVWYCFNLVFIPNEADAALLELPKSLYFMYFFLRPFRLVVKLGLSLLPSFRH